MGHTVRKLILFNMMSLDGYFAGADGDISWHRVDEEVNEYIIEQLKTADTLVFGRKTFQVMEDFWPTDRAFELEKATAEMMNRYQKIVFSTTLGQPEWQNTWLFRDKVADTIRNLKRQPGRHLFVFGSGHLCQTLIKNDLIDEFRLMLHPLTLGAGEPLFHTQVNLQLLKAKVFGNGNILCCYRQEKNAAHDPA
jgi:dihydrofolate reductase